MARWVGLILFVALSWLYIFSGLLAPTWGVAVLWALWIVQLGILIRVWRAHPWVVLAIPFVSYLIWAGVLLVGDVFLGWTA